MTFSPMVIAVLLITVPAAAQEASTRDPLETVLAPRTGSGEDAAVAIAAAWRVVEAAREAARPPDDRDAMQRHARRVLAVVDPALAPRDGSWRNRSYSGWMSTATWMPTATTG